MKKLIAVFSVALVLVFSCVLTSFADDSVVSGYAVDNVPYSPMFDGVLTSSDKGSQIYSSSENRTYNFSSAVAAPATDSNAVYYYKSITDLIPKWLWRGSNSPAITFPVNNGYTGIRFLWSENSSGQTFYQQDEIQPFSKMQAGRKYRISFSFLLTRTSGTFKFYLGKRWSTDTVILPLLSLSGYMRSESPTHYTVDFTVPEGGVQIVPVIKGSLSSGGNGYSDVDMTFYINDFTITDITTEDLDKSLDKLGDKIDSSINPSVPYEKWDNGSLKDSAGKLKDAESKLPTVDFNAIEELKNSVDISSYSHAFASINQLFIRLVDTVGITPLIFFACFFGFCIFLIGRKLSGG